VIPLTSEGILNMDVYDQLLTEKTKIVAITHISNALGVVNPVKKIIGMAHSKNIPVMIDGAQGIVHEEVDVQDLDCDFYCFSGHKFYGPHGGGRSVWKRVLAGGDASLSDRRRDDQNRVVRENNLQRAAV
jgi:cysteine desulfurase / selenocysteine lyase